MYKKEVEICLTLPEKMKMNLKTIQFILEHENEETSGLILSASKFPEVDMLSAVRAIEARRKLITKVPLWYQYPTLTFPYPLALEQCSSELTSRYKQMFISEGDLVADLTGGLGVDSYFMSQVASRVDYFERNKQLCEASAENFATLNAFNIFVFNDNIDVLSIDKLLVGEYNLIFIDPARRGGMGERKYALQECEPNFLEIKEALFKHTKRILLKASPMADITTMIRLLPETSQVHIVGTKGECKELLFFLIRDFDHPEPTITAADLSNEGMNLFPFSYSQENEAIAIYDLPSEPRFLYEPSKSALKAGCFKLLSSTFGIPKIAPSTHLYISNEPKDDFPGKCFQIVEIVDFNKRSIKDLAARYPKASLTARNFPIDTAELRKRTGIKEGDKYHIFAVTFNDGSKKMIVTISC